MHVTGYSYLCSCFFLFDESTEKTTFLLMGKNKMIENIYLLLYETEVMQYQSQKLVN